jgi:hypothetical protein
LRQKVGVNKTSTEKISRRPSSMANEHTQVWKVGEALEVAGRADDAKTRAGVVDARDHGRETSS